MSAILLTALAYIVLPINKVSIAIAHRGKLYAVQEAI